MALSTYSELKAAIILQSHRDDLDLQIDDFIKIAETEMFNHPIKSMRLRQMEFRSTATITDRFVALPDDFRFMRRLRLVVDDWEQDLMYRAPEQLIIQPASGRPSYFTISSQLEFDRVPDSDYTIEMQYIGDVTALSESAPTNDVLTLNPSVYLYGALWALFVFAQMPQEAAGYYTLFSNAIAGANKQAEKGRIGTAPMMRIEGCTP